MVVARTHLVLISKHFPAIVLKVVKDNSSPSCDGYGASIRRNTHELFLERK
jgi:hypothetical protein